VRLRKRAAGLAMGAGVLFFLGTNVRAGWLFVIAALLLGAVVAGVVLPLWAVRGLLAELDVPAETRQREPALVDVRLTNPTRGVRWELVVADEHLEPTAVFAGGIRPGGRFEATTLRTPMRRGWIGTAEVEVRSAAPFGVAERRRRLPVRASTLVLPAVVPLGELAFVEPVGTSERALHSSPRRGTGPDYLGVREYRAGDSMRHVHWPSTARTGAVMVREFEQERTRRLAIVVDTERDVGEAWTPLDRCCCVAASVAAALTWAGHGVRMAAATGTDQVDVLARVDEGELERWLAELVPSGTPLAEVLDALGPADLRGVETAVVTFPAFPSATLVPAVARLASRIARVVCVPVGLTEDEIEAGEADVAALADALRGTGAVVMPWEAGGDLAACLGAGTTGVSA
jgi:uncharacterized protein (DUF58 family)